MAKHDFLTRLRQQPERSFSCLGPGERGRASGFNCTTTGPLPGWRSILLLKPRTGDRAKELIDQAKKSVASATDKMTGNLIATMSEQNG
ncbi:MAG: hypothetical protein V1766_12880 [Pseudomonadota bacterium]